VDTEELEARDPLHCGPIDVDRGVRLPPFSVVQDQLFDLTDVEGEVVLLAPHCQVSDLHPVGCLIAIGRAPC
jgi:hypothetical protein